MTSMAILSCGMISSVGFSAPASCAAIRCGITGFVETQFVFGANGILGAEVPLGNPRTGRSKLLELAVSAISECLESGPEFAVEEVPLLLGLAERDRPGRFGRLDASFFNELEHQLGVKFHSDSAVISAGRMSGVLAMELVKRLAHEGRTHVVIAGADSYFSGVTLAEYNRRRWLLTSENSDGFIPGEAAAAVLVGPVSDRDDLVIAGVGKATEQAILDSGIPLRGLGLSGAIKSAMADAQLEFEDLDYRICDANGLQYFFKEGSLALAKVLRPSKSEFDVWHPADCIGEVGAASVPAVLSCALTAHRKRYSPGSGILCHFASFDEKRGALVLRAVAA